MTDAPEDDYSGLAAPLSAWLIDRLDGVDDVKVGHIDRPSGGYSAETLIVPVSITRAGVGSDEQIVLRQEVPEPPVYPVQVPLENEIEIQWRVMSELAAHSQVPIAPLVGYADRATLHRALTRRANGIQPSRQRPTDMASWGK